jgi:hypothetical protein
MSVEQMILIPKNMPSISFLKNIEVLQSSGKNIKQALFIH